MIIERIRREHGYMLRLLAILNRKLTQLEQEQLINYSLVYEVVDYLATHSEKVHHPKEDILYHYFVKHYGNEEQIENLETEHVELSERTHQFLETVEMILQDAVVPHDIFVGQLSEFIQAQKRHLDLEERSILPMIQKAFTTQDWQAVESEWSLSDDDPVFGETIADRYQQLAQRVRTTEQEAI
ncbi:hemerythrin domain-containing protein [Vibrio mexicanus]|uniref:hemerythrin domain-containing protein n=1 Tax=Vibrio mexicanus TaxID=1004326 RepID=UPI00063BFF5E|nr:hemerythrin domain-containing protein [Vibrio mexicanus]